MIPQVGENRQTVISILEQAASQDPELMAAADQLIRQWETKRQFHATLFDIFADQGVSATVRLMAIITFKNGIDKYWKRTALHPITIAEKELIRPHLLSLFGEDNPKIAAQYCVAMSRIARWEFPMVWPTFAEDLLTHIQSIANSDSATGTMEHNALYTMHLFIKSLCGRALARQRQALRNIAPVIFKAIAPIYAQRITQFNQVLQTAHVQSERSQQLLRSIRFCIKTLRRLYVMGFEKIEQADSAVHEFYLATISHQAAFYQVFGVLSQEQRESDHCLVLRKIILLYGKMYLDFQKYNPICFITMPLAAKSILEWYWIQIQAEAPKLTATVSADSEGSNLDALVLEPLLIQGLKMYKDVAKNFFYTADDSGHMDDDTKRCRLIIDEQILTSLFVSQMADMLMCHYIPLKPKDLEMWQDDPEGWLIEEGSDYWEFDVRRCAERLFVDIVNQQRELMIPELVQMLKQNNIGSASAPTNGSKEQFFRQEGLYAALGLCASDLYDHVDFCQWLKQHPAVDSPMGVIKWRIAWLIGKWIVVKFPANERAHVYVVLLELAASTEPLVVRMEAVSALLATVDDWDFDAEVFAPYLPTCLERLTSLLDAVTMTESRMRIVNLLSVVVSRMDRRISPFAESIVNLIPPLWRSAAGENLYQTSVLALITRLVGALGAQSTALQPFVAPLIEHSINLDNPAHVYLIDDGIDLWLSLLRNSTTLDPSFAKLLQYLPRLLKYSTDTLKDVLKVIEAYTLLSSAEVFQSNGHAILAALHDLINDDNLVVRAIAAGYYTLGVIVQCVPAEIAASIMAETQLLWTPITRIIDRKDAAIVLTHHSLFLSRVTVHYPALFAECTKLLEEGGQSNAFARHWVDSFDDLGQVAHKRLHALGLATAIATTANQGILASVPQMLPIWNEILSDTGSSQLYFSDPEDSVHHSHGEDDDELVVPENERRRKLLSNDPVHKAILKDVLVQSLAQCEQLNGPELFQAIFAQADQNEVEDLKNQLN